MGEAPLCGRAILAQVKKGPQRGKFSPFSTCFVRVSMALFPAWAQLHTIPDVAAARNHFGVGDDVWHAWIANVGDPGTDLRLLAALPRSAVGGRLSNRSDRGRQQLYGHSGHPGWTALEIGTKGVGVSGRTFSR